MSDDLVSIVIPTYYRNEKLRSSINCAFEQTHDETEIIVVDDSGEEYASSIADDYEVIYIPHEDNRGGNAARNTGYEAANGEYIQFLDDDDEIFPRKISKQVDLLQNSPSTGVAYGGIIDRDGNEVLPSVGERGNSLELALQFFWPTTITSSLLISDDVLSQIYPLENRAAADDIGMKIELAKRTEFDFVNEVLTKIGDSVNSRSTGMDFVHELENIYEEYKPEYERVPEQVRRNALSDTYWTKAQVLLDENIWSLSAIYCYFVAIAYKRELDLSLLVSAIASLFGRPGLTLTRKIHQELIE